jgi:ubiquinone/menaquinone biosynthesis C-methylase UbiE
MIEKIRQTYSKEHMSNAAFRIMTMMFHVKNFILPVDKKLDNFDIQKGMTIMDYGCGPGLYIKKASNLVGENGKVYAVDIHSLALKAVNDIKIRHNLQNIELVKPENYVTGAPDNSVDLVYAFDMFHMIEQSGLFLNELHRIIKPGGKIHLEDGHQPRKRTIAKINNSGKWHIVDENKSYVTCTTNGA